MSTYFLYIILKHANLPYFEFSWELNTKKSYVDNSEVVISNRPVDEWLKTTGATHSIYGICYNLFWQYLVNSSGNAYNLKYKYNCFKRFLKTSTSDKIRSCLHTPLKKICIWIFSCNRYLRKAPNISETCCDM